MGQGVSDDSSEMMAVNPEYHFYHDMEGDSSLTTTLVSALAEARGVDIASLGVTLHDHVDTDALDAIFAPRIDGTPRDGSRLELSLLRHSVTVHGDGHIVVTERSGQPAP